MSFILTHKQTSLFVQVPNIITINDHLSKCQPLPATATIQTWNNTTAEMYFIFRKGWHFIIKNKRLYIMACKKKLLALKTIFKQWLKPKLKVNKSNPHIPYHYSEFIIFKNIKLHFFIKKKFLFLFINFWVHAMQIVSFIRTNNAKWPTNELEGKHVIPKICFELRKTIIKYMQ